MTSTTDIEFNTVIKPNNTFLENLFFNVKANIDLNDYGFTSPKQHNYFFRDIFKEISDEQGNNPKDASGRLMANPNDLIRIFTFSREAKKYTFLNAVSEFNGTISNSDPVGQSTPSVFHI